MLYATRSSILVLLLCSLQPGCTAGTSSSVTVGATKVAVAPACGIGKSLYNTLPMLAPQIAGIGPLGGFAPPLHIFPEDFISLYVPQFGGVASLGDVVAPGDIVVTQVSRTTWTSPTAYTEYKLWFRPCQEHLAYFNHVGNLNPAIVNQIGDIVLAGCTTTASNTVCTQTVNFALSAGTPIGQAGGIFGPALEFAVSDTRTVPGAYLNPGAIVNPPIDLYADCPLDYFDVADKTWLYSKLGNSDGSIPRTITPLCGKVAQDLVASAQGKWFNPLFPSYLEAEHLTLGHDNANPGNGALSVGNSLTTATSNVYTFVANPTGLYNRDFATITADGNIYCYQVLQLPGGIPTSQLYILQMTSPTTLKIEAFVQVACGGGPWGFDPWAVTYQR